MDELERRLWGRYRSLKFEVRQRVDKNGNQIELRLTREEFIKIWMDSGHAHEMGRHEGQYCMARHNDIGHYEIGNVEIKPFSENAREGNVGKTLSTVHKDSISEHNRTRVWKEESKEKLRCRVYSDESRKKMSTSQRGKKASEATLAELRSRRHTEETKRKIGEAGKGKKRTEETKAKMRESAKVGWGKRRLVLLDVFSD